MNLNLRMYCIFSKEAINLMNGNRGKMAAQAGHAYLHAYWDAEAGHLDHIRETARLYKISGQATKVCLIAENEEELRILARTYYAKCGFSLVTDAGKTVFKEPTVTCLGLGPIKEEDIGEDLKALKVFI